MSGEQLEKYEDEIRSILGIIRSGSNVQNQLDAVEITEVYETDPNGNLGSMISAVQLEVPNYRVHETIGNGKKKKVNGTLDCAAVHNLKTGNKYAIAHTVKDNEFTKEEAVGLYKKRFPVQENDFKLKKKVELAVQKIRDFGAKIKRKMEKKREKIVREKEIIFTPF